MKARKKIQRRMVIQTQVHKRVASQWSCRIAAIIRPSSNCHEVSKLMVMCHQPYYTSIKQWAMRRKVIKGKMFIYENATAFPQTKLYISDIRLSGTGCTNDRCSFHAFAIFTNFSCYFLVFKEKQHFWADWAPEVICWSRTLRQFSDALISYPMRGDRDG